MMSRDDGRQPHELRPVAIQRGFTRHAEGSVLISMGDTRVICTATVEERVPPFLLGTGRGWVTAEYGMLPRATNTRTGRERQGPGGRSHEIQRLVGRSLRAAVDMQALGPRTITVDCDVIQADAGTRTASITGGMVALEDAVEWLLRKGLLPSSPLVARVAAVSVGMLDGVPLLDLSYSEDSRADVDLNVVMLDHGGLVEVQGTAERRPFSRADLDRMLDLAAAGVGLLNRRQVEARAAAG